MLQASERRRGVASRISGRDAITRSIAALVIRVGRFALYRARTDADRRWAAKMLDELDLVLMHARETDNK